MGVGASANRTRSSQDMWQNNQKDMTSNTNSNTRSSSILDSLRNMFQQNQQQQTGSTVATFDPRGDAILKNLSSSNPYVEQAGSAFGSMTGGAVSPYTEDIIRASNAEADKNFAGRLAQTRAGAYRGGTAANLNGQGQLAADYSAQQGGHNAALRQGAYDNAQTLKLGGASGLASLGQNQQGLGANILSLLRGQTSTGSQVGTTTGSETGQQTGQQESTTIEQTIQKIIEALRGGQSGTTSGTGAQASAGWSSVGGFGR